MNIKTIKGIEDYIENLNFSIYFHRLQMERSEAMEKLPQANLEITLSNRLSAEKKRDLGIFDDLVLEIKKQDMIKLLENNPNGVYINEDGNYLPYDSFLKIKKSDDDDEIFGKGFI